MKKENKPSNRQNMNSQQAKQFRIADYLHSLGINPDKTKGYDFWYRAPYRHERTASLKVDTRNNVWFDHGTGKCGNILDIVMLMHNVGDISGALAILSNKTIPTVDFSFSNSKNDLQNETQTNRILNVIPITHPKLIEYVAERKISLDLANLYCREVHYQNSAGKFFSVGFQNDKCGYELNSPNDFKGCISPKDITTFQNNADACLVFEGFWDFLSYLTIQNIERTKHDVAVLNSVANVQKALPFLKAHREIYTYLDNDEGGRNATEQIKANCISVTNRSERYVGFKDLNDYLCAKKLTLDKPKKRSLKL
jgi:DNA primase